MYFASLTEITRWVIVEPVIVCLKIALNQVIALKDFLNQIMAAKRQIMGRSQ